MQIQYIKSGYSHSYYIPTHLLLINKEYHQVAVFDAGLAFYSIKFNHFYYTSNSHNPELYHLIPNIIQLIHELHLLH